MEKISLLLHLQMKTTTSHRIIRFRRWSRNGYAIFSSLGRCVTIGTLGRNIADASLKKQKAGICINRQGAEKQVSDDDVPEDDLPSDVFFHPELRVQSLLAADTYCPEYNLIDTKRTNDSRKDMYISVPASFFYLTNSRFSIGVPVTTNVNTYDRRN